MRRFVSNINLRMAVFAVIFSFIFTSVTYAEESQKPKKGFKITKDTVLNIGLSVTPEYETNIRKASEDSSVEDKLSGQIDFEGVTYDMILHYAPSLRLKHDNRKNTVGLALYFDYNHYLGLDSKSTTKKFSDLDISSDFLGEFNKDGMAIFDINNSFTRTATPNGQDLSGIHRNLLEKFDVGLGLKNLEDTLYMKISAGFDFNYFEESKDQSSYKDFNYYSVVGNVFGRWKFLPRTMLFIKGGFRYQDFYESRIRDSSKTMPLNVFAGLAGQITPHISAKLSGGYSAAFGKTARHDFNANAEVVFKYFDKTFLSAGYLKNLRPSANYQHYSTHRLYLDFKQKFAKYFLGKVNFSYSFINFGSIIEFDKGYTYNSATNEYTKDTSGVTGGNLIYTVEVPGKNRKDQLMLVAPSISYNILRWLGLKVGYEFQYRRSNFERITNATFNSTVNPLSDYDRTYRTFYDFMNHKVFLTLTLDY